MSTHLPDFPTLLEAHMAAQDGCYISGVDELADGGRFLWCAALAEPALNLAIGSRDPALVRAAAVQRQRLPAMLVGEAEAAGLLASEPGSHAFPTAWMVRDAHAAPAPALPGFTLDITTGGPPAPAFGAVARALYAAPEQVAAAELYVAVVEAATPPPGITSWHLTLSDGAGLPVAAASLYRSGNLAGLYNVGTRASHRGRGLGAAITRAALELAAHGGAAQEGAAHVFLQCAGHGAVEALYARLGFSAVARPSLVLLP